MSNSTFGIILFALLVTLILLITVLINPFIGIYLTPFVGISTIIMEIPDKEGKEK